MTTLSPIHPGRILKEEFLDAMQLSQYRLAKEIYEPQTKIGQIVRGLRSITPKIGLKLDKFFGFKTEGFFYGLQTDYDMFEAKRELGAELAKIHTFHYDNNETNGEAQH